MEELRNLCASGSPLTIPCHTDLVPEVVQLLAERNYVRIVDDDGEGDDTTTVEQAVENFLFVQASCRPADLESLRQALEHGKETVMLLPHCLAEMPQVGSLLAEFGYGIAGEASTSLAMEDGNAAPTMKLLYKLTWTQYADGVPTVWAASPAATSYFSLERGGDADSDWKACACYQQDTTRLRSGDQQFQIDVPIFSSAGGSSTQQQQQKQIVGINVLVEPFAKLDQFHLSIKLKVTKLRVGVSMKNFLDDGSRLGFYPEYIKLSLEPNLAHAETIAIPTCLEVDRTPSWTKVLHENVTQVGAQVGYGPVQISLKHDRKVGWEDDMLGHKLEAIDEEAGGNVATFEWRILKWGNGKRYKEEWPQYSAFRLAKLPKLPFTGPAPKLEKFAEVKWMLPSSCCREHPLTFNLKLDFRMKMLWTSMGRNSAFKFGSPRSQARSLSFHDTIDIKLPKFA